MAKNQTSTPVLDELEKESLERLELFAQVADKPELCAEKNHFDWKFIQHFNLNRVHLCIICDTVVGTG